MHIKKHYFIHVCWLFLKSLKAFSVSLTGKNKIKVIHSWNEAKMRHGAGLLEWRVDKLEELDRETQKLLIIYKDLHPKSDVDRLYVSSTLPKCPC